LEAAEKILRETLTMFREQLDAERRRSTPLGPKAAGRWCWKRCHGGARTEYLDAVMDSTRVQYRLVEEEAPEGDEGQPRYRVGQPLVVFGWPSEPGCPH
jgi:hypothetical protein